MILRPLGPLPAAASLRPGRRWPWAFGPRFFVLFALGLPFLALAWIDRRAALLLAAWDALVVAAWIADLRRMPPPAALRLTRAWSAPLAIGVPARVELSLENHGSVAIVADVADHAAASLKREPARLILAVPEGASAAAEYDVEPRERGDAMMSVATVSYRSAWRIAERWGTAALEQTVRVYPDLVEARRQAMYLVRSRQVALEKRRARVAGIGRDFESLRDYREGDEVRDICWTATARRAKVVTRVYQPERSQAVWILVDCGRLLRARTGADTKLDRMVNAALALAQVAMAAGDRVAVLAYGRRPQHRVPPGRGPQHLRAIVDALALARTEPAEADHVTAAAHVLTLQKRRALVVWLTELAETAGIPDVIESASRLTSRHVVLFGVMQQPDMHALAAAVPAGASGMFRGLAAQETLERRDVLLGNLRQRGALAVELGPLEMSTALVTEYLSVKDRNLV